MLFISDVTSMPLVYNVFQFIASMFLFLVDHKFFEGIRSWNMIFFLCFLIETSTVRGSAIHKEGLKLRKSNMHVCVFHLKQPSELK